MLLLMILVFFLDSTWLSNHVTFGQWIANVVTVSYFVWMYRRANLRIKRTMKYAVLIATVGEIVLCLILGMYEYRLENIPIYVPLGHAILYTTVWYITHDPWIVKQQSTLIPWMAIFTIVYAILLYVTDNDMYGLICTFLLLILLLFNPTSRRFFFIMFFAVAYLEQLGTAFDCWYWHSTLLDQEGWINSGNPPSGISLFYFGLDMLCLGVYLFRKPAVRKRWRRPKELVN